MSSFVFRCDLRASSRRPPRQQPAYGLGAPGIVFGRVTRWMIQPINQVNGIQVSTFTKPAFGDWRRFASFVTQIAAQSQRRYADDAWGLRPSRISPP